ncbi:MAG: hypothetical protein QOH41_4007 [Blastocatellia bacterium]|jgi:hypothetical protein|nr:hypothetical protein [Blastocatellia bacterium]
MELQEILDGVAAMGAHDVPLWRLTNLLFRHSPINSQAELVKWASVNGLSCEFETFEKRGKRETLARFRGPRRAQPTDHQAPQ